VLQLSANDIDLQPRLSYSIVSGNHDNAFVISQQTGLLSVDNKLDYERLTSYQLQVQVYLLTLHDLIERLTSYRLQVQVYLLTLHDLIERLTSYRLQVQVITVEI